MGTSGTPMGTDTVIDYHAVRKTNKESLIYKSVHAMQAIEISQIEKRTTKPIIILHITSPVNPAVRPP